MAYNVHGYRAGMARVAEAIAAEAPDVVFLNEAGYLGFGVARLARRLRMERASGARLRRSIPNAVLVRPPWRVVERQVAVFGREGRTLRRGAVVAVIGRAGMRVTAVAVHLGLAGAERLRHVRELTDLLAGRHGRTLMGGDLNEGPDGRAVAWISQRYWDAFAGAGDGDGYTFPSREPRARIDYLFVSEGIRVDRAWVGAAAKASDHLPVIADIVVTG